MTSPLLDLHAEQLIIEDAHERVKQLVIQARYSGYSWASIAEMLELDADECRERYTPVVRAFNRAATAAANEDKLQQGP